MQVSRRLVGHSGQVEHMAVREGMLATGSEDGTVRLWDVRSESCRAGRCFVGVERVTSVQFCGDLEICASHGCDVSVFDRRRPELVLRESKTTLRSVCSEEISCLAALRDGASVAAADDGGSVTLVSLSDDQSVIRTYNGHHSNVCSCVVANPKVQGEFASCALDGTLCQWDDRKGRPIASRRFQSGGQQGQVANPAWPHSMDVSPDGRCLAVGLGDGSLALFAWRSLRPLASVPEVHASTTSAVTFAGQGSLLATGGNDRTLTLWRLSHSRSGSTVRSVSRADLGSSKVNWLTSDDPSSLLFVATDTSDVLVVNLPR